MIAKLRITSIVLLAALTLAACNDDDGDDDNGNGNGGGNGGEVSGDPQDQFGSTFADAFNADANDEPIDPVAGDAGGPSLTDDPEDS